MNNPFPSPSDHARQLVKGAYDIHVHIDPDVIARRITDVQLAQRFAELGLAGFVLKSHYAPTAERASVVRSVVTQASHQVNVLGSLVLNNPVGGMNPVAAEIAGRSGARIVWMPTTDAANEANEHARMPAGAKLPLWAKIQLEMRTAGLDPGPVAVVDAQGELLPATRQVLSVIAKHQMIAATGHLGRDEIFAVVDGALEAGIKQIIVTHPDYPTQNLSIADQLALAERGAWLERCFTTPHTGKIAWDRMIEVIRATDPARTVLSTDLGQPANPPVEDGLALFADRLLTAGFTDEEVYTMVVTNSIRLATGKE